VKVTPAGLLILRNVETKKALRDVNPSYM